MQPRKSATCHLMPNNAEVWSFSDTHLCCQSSSRRSNTGIVVGPGSPSSSRIERKREGEREREMERAGVREGGSIMGGL